jgi:hypothetical protein
MGEKDKMVMIFVPADDLRPSVVVWPETFDDTYSLLTKDDDMN